MHKCTYIAHSKKEIYVTTSRRYVTNGLGSSVVVLRVSGLSDDNSLVVKEVSRKKFLESTWSLICPMCKIFCNFPRGEMET
jgi:hypothetical protein